MADSEHTTRRELLSIIESPTAVFVRPACFRSSNLFRSGVDLAPLITRVLKILAIGG